MPRTLSFFLVFFLLFPVAGVLAQEAVPPPPEENPEESPVDDDYYYYDTMYTKGDKTFLISLGLVLPTVFTGSGLENTSHNLGTGGTGSLSFNYFLNSNFFLGGELGGMFTFTRLGNAIYIIPFGVRAGYQFVVRRFEFPISLFVGAAPQKYMDDGYFGLVVRPGASAFWRFSPDWSFGVNGIWWFVPQWPKDGYNVNGNFLELTLSARYHF